MSAGGEQSVTLSRGGSAEVDDTVLRVATCGPNSGKQRTAKAVERHFIWPTFFWAKVIARERTFSA
jgi:hypothetical protein